MIRHDNSITTSKHSGQGGFEPRKLTAAEAVARQIRSGKQWQAARDYAMSRCEGLCCYCYDAPAQEVHHIRPLETNPELAYEQSNLLPVCKRCHGWLDTRTQRGEDVISQIEAKVKVNQKKGMKYGRQ